VDTFPINEPTPTIPKLYQVENEGLVNDRKAQSYVPPPPQQQPQPQKTFKKPASSLQQPLAMPDAKQAIHKVIAPEEDFQDGWGDDDLDVDDEDATNIADEAVTKLQPPPPQRPSQPTATSTTTAPPLLPPKHAQKSITKREPPSPYVASRMDVSPQAPPLLNYNPEDDIVPTRKRWVNPRPGSRQLRV
jgi:hypothetical protein